MKNRSNLPNRSLRLAIRELPLIEPIVKDDWV